MSVKIPGSEEHQVSGRHPGKEKPIRVLLVHAVPLSRQGGAEISLRYHVEHAPADVSVDTALPDENQDLRRFDVVVLGNLRPEGGLGEEKEAEQAIRWSRLVRRFAGFSIKSERDIHPCAHRDARCVVGPPFRKAPCDCGPLIPRSLEALYNSCSAVQYLSPAHREVVNQIVRVRTPQVVIASPVDPARFRNLVPYECREPKALIMGDAIRVAPTALQRALAAGFEPEFMPYHAVPHDQMPALLNRFKAVVVDPVMFHAYGRLAMEALMCGCKVLASERVGCMSFRDPLAATLRANDEFWRFVRRGLTAPKKLARRLKMALTG